MTEKSNIIYQSNQNASELLENTNLALLNILEDFNQDKKREEELHMGIMNILEDLNKEKQTATLLNEQLQKEIIEHKFSETKLKASNQDLESFSYSVSHDLRAPLRHITGFIELLKNNTQSSFDEKALKYLDTINNSAKRLGNLIDELLNFSRLGRTELKMQEVILEQLIKEVIEDFKNEFPDRNFKWKIGPFPIIEADPVLIKQVIINLISNAIKFSKERNPAIIEVGCKFKQNGFYLFYVKDNGVGFDELYRKKLFGVFQRLHSNAEFEGNGIGLAIIKSIINKHGGEVYAEGQINKGASFYFTLKSKEKKI